MTVETLTTAEAAAELKIQADAVKQMCLRGQVPAAIKRSNRWFLPAAWVRAEVRRRLRAAGTPRVGHPYAVAKNPESGQTRHLGNGTPPAVIVSDIVTNPAGQ